MRAEQCHADDFTRCRFDEIVYQQHVTDRLRHLLVIDAQETVMYPVTREVPAIMSAAALCQLVLVMRKDQVLTAGVNIDGLAQVFRGHRRTLDVPARTAPAPR